jgi:hypothetical protein
MKLVNEKQVMDTIELLGWKDVSTYRQKKNGTIIYRLPIKMYGKYIEVGSFQSGYVRRMNGCYTPYQLNKCEPNVEYFKDYKWCDTRDEQYWTGKYNKYVGKRRIIIRGEVARLRYLVLYCLKNYYINQANQVEDGKYIPKWKHERELKKAGNGDFLKCVDTDDMINFEYSGGQITNLENGDVFVHEQHAYWNKWQEEKPSSVEIIIDGHRYKVK